MEIHYARKITLGKTMECFLDNGVFLDNKSLVLLLLLLLLFY